MIESNNIDSLYKNIVIDVLANGIESSPRGKPIKELIAQQLILTNPLQCLITIKQRKLNYRFAIIEKMEYLWGKHDADRLIAYNPNMKNYVGKYNYFDGNYSQRFNYWLDHIYQLLKNDRDSRQAVISIYDGNARHQSSDIPCTLTLQFLIRDEALHLIVNMRSNDLLWGFPYDVNAFCFIQEVMASWLEIKLGNYYHNVGSLHAYTEPKENYDQLRSINGNTIEYNSKQNPIWNLNYEQTKKWLPLFFHLEEKMRTEQERYDVFKASEMPPVLIEYLDILQTKWFKDENKS